MRRSIFFLVITLILSWSVFAIAAESPTPLRLDIQPPQTGAARSICELSYWNNCSGWIWHWYGASRHDEAGTVFDLPVDCGISPGDPCENTGIWWYWANTEPGHGYLVGYRMYEVDENNCKVGPPVAEIPIADHSTGWNYIDGLGPVPPSGRVAIVAHWLAGYFPVALVDNNVANQHAGCGSIPTESKSFIFRHSGEGYGPPEPLEDELGYVNLIMRAEFDCQPTGVEATSWTGVKSLFR